MKLRLSKKQTDAVLCITAALFLVIQYYVKPHAATVKRSCYAEMTAAARTMARLQKWYNAALKLTGALIRAVPA